MSTYFSAYDANEKHVIPGKFEVMQITRVSKGIKTNGTSGYLGLAHPESEESKQINFLHQLGRKGIIDINKLGFSFHYSKEEEGESYMRLGAITKVIEDSLIFMGTLDNSWRIHSEILFIGNRLIFDDDNTRDLIIEPSSPYIHVPFEDFKIFRKKLEQQIEGIKCSDEYGCHFNDKCENIKQENIYLSIVIYCGSDNDHKYDISIPFKDLLVDSEKLI